MAIYEHLKVCTGHHDRDGECLIGETTIDETITVAVQGIPCDNAVLWVEGFVASGTALDELIAKLQQLRPTLVAARADADCEGHDHSDDD